ncbi:MAG: sigma-70 family RNA polymerase sigma factor [Actinomycetota bacterium]|nr:sigma-70 family RNA polymerase sigma factor [Actinomycetota bacterium]
MTAHLFPTESRIVRVDPTMANSVRSDTTSMPADTIGADLSDRQRADLVVANLAVAERLAGRWARGGRPDEDLRQVAVLGLVLAARRYQPARGDFLTFAVPTIIGELKRHLRDATWLAHVPRRVKENLVAVERTRTELTTLLGRSPTAAEIARASGVAEAAVLEAMEAGASRRGSPRPEGSDDARTGGHDERIDAVDRLMSVEAAVTTLDEAQRDLLRMRYGDELTQEEIGRILGISQPQVHRRIRAVLALLRDRLGDT